NEEEVPAARSESEGLLPRSGDTMDIDTNDQEVEKENTQRNGNVPEDNDQADMGKADTIEGKQYNKEGTMQASVQNDNAGSIEIEPGVNLTVAENRLEERAPPVPSSVMSVAEDSG